MNAHHETGFMLGEIKVSPSHNTLWSGDRSLKLQPKAMAVLYYLACHHSRVISNEELIAHLWEGRVVTHGSVQKSINTLRSALNELTGERELIAHYSKRGYQLMIKPQFLERLASPLSPELTVNALSVNSTSLRKWHQISLVALALVAFAILYKTVNWDTFYLPNQHKTAFHTIHGYTNETGHERSATPHPDNQHIAYIREKRIRTGQDASTYSTESEIVIRNATGKDWRIANSNGNWFKLAWSPQGNNLVAIEIRHRDGSQLGPQFYQPPNSLYSFHIFTLDFSQERLLEKQQLSQWQGHIFTVTWWDENTLEIVAKQGPNSGNGRYRYSIENQQLDLLDDLEDTTNPVASAVLNKKTAIASRYKSGIRIDFLNNQQQRISRSKLDIATADISWIPDGSGVLVYAEDERKLLAVYLDGKQVAIPLADSKDKVFSRPRYSADGSGIFYTEEKRSSNILLTALDSSKKSLTENHDFNYAASFSPDGEKVVYASVRNNQIHLWLIENGRERQVTQAAVAKKIDSIIWSNDGKHFVFNAGNQVFRHSLATGETILLLDGTDNIEPLAYYPSNNQLLVIKHAGETRNIWRMSNDQQKQLTFGAVGSAIEYAGDIYFQYVSEAGLWALRGADDTLEQVTSSLNEYSKLLKADNGGIYFINGGICQESDIQHQDFTTGNTTTFIRQRNSAVTTTSFNVKKGVLQTECNLPEANIVLLK